MYEFCVFDRTRVQCWVYMLQNFPDSMLTKPLLESYLNTEEQPYTERSLRDIKIRAKDDLDF